MNPQTNSRPEAGRSDPAAGHPARLAVGVIGAGRAGTALGVALARAGHQIVAVSAVSEASLRRAHANFPDAVVTDPGQVLGHADLALADRSRRRAAGPDRRAGGDPGAA